MLTSISPLGERIKGNRWVVTVSWLTAGSMLGGAILGAGCGLIGMALFGRLADSARILVLVGAFLAAAPWDFFDRRFPGRRQVDENWLTSYRSWVYGGGFGVQLGVGLATVVFTALVPVMMLAAMLSDSLVAAIAIGIVFGATRGASLLLAASVRTPADLRQLHRRLDEYDARVRRAGAVSALGLGVIGFLAVGI
jgi:hypothetical protein